MNVSKTIGDNEQALPESQANHFALSIRREADGPELKRVPVPGAYIRDIEHELLLKYALRRGMPEATVQDMQIQLTPVHADGENSKPFCRSVRADVRNPRGEKFRLEYNVHLFSDVARSAVQQMVADGDLKVEDEYHYQLVVDHRKGDRLGPGLAGMSFGAGPKQEPLQYLTRSLTPLIADAQPVGELNGEHFPVFYTSAAYERAERFARRGGDAQPPRETGAALVGTACSCPESGELFLVITDALEASDAEEAKVSLSYTGKTWLRLQAILKSMQAQPDTRTYRFLGQAHGHNFIPLDGAPPCELCSTAKVCSRTSVFVSTDDRTWTQAVFAGAPYALCHIFGLNARHDKVHGLYSLHENRLTQRGFYIIPDFDPTAPLHKPELNTEK